MYIIIFKAWDGQRCKVISNEEEAKKKYDELNSFYSDVKLFKIDKEMNI